MPRSLAGQMRRLAKTKMGADRERSKRTEERSKEKGNLKKGKPKLHPNVGILNE